MALFLPQADARFSGTLYIAIHLALTAIMLLTWRKAVSMPDAGPEVWRRRLIWMIAAGLAARVILIPVPLLTSNDVERYLWDGAVLLSGYDPYTTTPDSEALASLRKGWPTPREHGAYPTIYPPAALAVFAFSALAGPVLGIWVWKTLLALAGIALTGLCWDLLARRGLLRHAPLILLSPLLVLEGGIGAHLDLLTALAVAGALAAADRGRMGLAGIALGLGACLKLLPILLLGPLVVALCAGRAARLVAGGLGTVAAIYGTALLLGFEPIGNLPVFFEKWRFGAPLYAALAAVLTGPALSAALGAMAMGGIAWAAHLAWRGRRHRGQQDGPLCPPVLNACLITLATALLVSPVVFPWYLCTLMPLIALRPGAMMLAWVGAAPFSYEVLNRWRAEGVWDPAAWPLIVLAAALLAGAAWDSRAGRNRS